jgi:hypothetical protein
LKEWTTPDFRNTPSTPNLEEEEIVDAPGKGGKASMPEQVKRPNPWRKMMMMMIVYNKKTCYHSGLNGVAIREVAEMQSYDNQGTAVLSFTYISDLRARLFPLRQKLRPKKQSSIQLAIQHSSSRQQHSGR